MNAPTDTIAPLRDFVAGMTRLVERTTDEPTILAEGRKLLSALIADDAWLPEAFTVPNPTTYSQYLLYCDPLERFSVVSFVWGPGQKTPVHDHTVWGLVGMLRGAELCQEYEPQGGSVVAQGRERHVFRADVSQSGPDLLEGSFGVGHDIELSVFDRAAMRGFASRRSVAERSPARPSGARARRLSRRIESRRHRGPTPRKRGR